MKMGLLFSGIFWGAMLVILGITVMLNFAFGIRLPIFRVLLALFFFYLGISLLSGIGLSSTRTRSTAEIRRLEAGKPEKRYDVIFGRGIVDLTGVMLKENRVTKVDVNTVFGASTIRVNPAIPTKVVVSSAFASARMPDGNSVAFGESTYRSDSLTDCTSYLLVNASVVFGSTEVVK
jgi:hypothetical protein